MSLSNSLRAFLTVEWLHCSGGRSSSLGQLWREEETCGVWVGEVNKEDKDGEKRRGKREDEGNAGMQGERGDKRGERRA